MTQQECCNCYTLFWIPASMHDARRNDGKSFYCPNGHPQSYTETENARLQRELAEAQRKAEREELQRVGAQTRARMAEEEAGKLRRKLVRVNGGKCPYDCCKRIFSDVKRHIAVKHAEEAGVAPLRRSRRAAV